MKNFNSTLMMVMVLFFKYNANSEVPATHDPGLYTMANTCQDDNCKDEQVNNNDEDVTAEQKMKYHLDLASHYYEAKTGKSSSEWTDAEMKHTLLDIVDKRLTENDIKKFSIKMKKKRLNFKPDEIITEDINIAKDLSSESDTAEQEPAVDEGDNGVKTEQYEMPKLVRLDPGQVGDEVEVELQDGVFYKRITMSVRPPVFEVPDFLTPEECDKIIETALNNGLNVSNLFGEDIQAEYDEDLDLSDISRISDQTWLREADIGKAFWDSLNTRIARLSHLDVGLVKRAEPIQVVKYMPGGHYHAHIDTTRNDVLPCCFQTRCLDKELTVDWNKCCRLCRFMTVLYYLNDVEEGGQTAFPLADMSDELYKEKMANLEKQDWYNLSRYCHNSSLIVSPKRGTAVMWYSHFIDDETGYLGEPDMKSHHGGCDLIKGTKWIANNWISGTPYEDRYKPSVFYIPPKD